jgi:hypothetical protein
MALAASERCPWDNVSSVDGRGEVPFQVLPPVLFSSNPTAYNSYVLEEGQDDITPPEARVGVPPPCKQREGTPPSALHDRPAATENVRTSSNNQAQIFNKRISDSSMLVQMVVFHEQQQTLNKRT